MTTAPSATQFCDDMRVNRFHWAIIVLGLSGLTFGGYTLHVLSYVMPGIIKEWNLSHVAAGTVVSWGLIGNGLGTVGLGMLADRVGRKWVFILALAIYSVFTGVMGWVHSFGVFSALRFLAGIGIGGATILNITIASEFAPSRVRGRMVSAMFTGLMIGPVICGLVSMAIIPTYGWRVILMLNLVPLILVPFLIIFLPESVRFLVEKGRYEKAIKILRRMERAAHVEPKEWSKESFILPTVQKKVSVKRLFTSKLAFMTILIWLAYILNHVSLYGVTTWLPTLLTHTGISLVKSYGYTVMDHVGAFFGTLFLGVVLDRFGRKGSLIIAYAAAAVVTWLFGIASGSPVALYVLSACTGFFIIGSLSAQHTVTAEIYPTFVRSTGIGWAIGIGTFGSVCGPLVGGLLQSSGFTFSQYFALLAIFPLLCAVTVAFYRINVKGESLETVEEEMIGAGQ